MSDSDSANCDKTQADQQETYYRHLFNGASFGIIGADRQGIVVNCNRVAESLFGVSRERILGQHITCVICDENADRLCAALELALKKERPAEFEVDRHNEDGEPITLAVAIGPILDDSGGLLGVGAWARDITNRKVLEEQLTQVEKMASLGTLASGVAHHFNNIIGGVATFVDYALQSENPQASRRALQMTAEAATRVSQITGSLLTFAEKDMRQFDLSDLTEVVLTFGHLVEGPLKEKGITFNLLLKPVPIFEVPGSRMHQVLGNLTDNAERAMCEGGTITIALEAREGDIVLTFEDTGCGIDDRNLPHVFEPFFTIPGTENGGNRPCAGLGLSVVHGVVRELGGSISISSKAGAGTKFEIRFPIKPGK